MRTVFKKTPYWQHATLLTLAGMLMSASTTFAQDAWRTATATATVIDRAVAAITVTDGGAGYDSNRLPTVTLIGGGGGDAMALSVVSNGVVTRINVSNGGGGYTNAPDVLIAEPPHTQSTVQIDMAPRFTIEGIVGTTNEIQYADALANVTLWQPLTNIVLPSSPYVFADLSAPPGGKRFYRLSAGTVSFENPDPANLVWIPAGTFTMGSPTNEQDRASNEGPQTTVKITLGFWMSIYPVMQGNYQMLMTNNPSAFPGDLRRPVEKVYWSDATNYCAQLTARELAANRLPVGYSYRLPTEAEWEYACRAGTTNRFYWGDDPDYTNITNYAWYFGNSGGLTHPVGQKRPNKWGLYDMNGNVVQWCSDWWQPYLSGGTVTNPVGPNSSGGHIIRGGSWNYAAKYCRSAERYYDIPSDKSSLVGFRVVLAPSLP